MDIKLEDALNRIKDECESHRNCIDCPLRLHDAVDTLCGIDNTSPNNWRVSQSHLPPRVLSYID